MTTSARKTAVPKKISSIPIKQPYDVPSGRLLELLQETVIPEPYEITPDLIIEPPTKERADRIREQQMKIMAAQTALNALVVHAEKNNQLLDREVLDALGDAIKDAQDVFTEALFGSQYQAVLDFFADRPDKLWQAFESDIQMKFFPSQPKSGACATCGHVVDEDAAGKG